jgi:hypothetical protein
MRRLIAIIGSSWLLFCQGLDAQENLDFKTIDRETYRMVMAEKWDSLITLGTKAMENEVDTTT